MSLSSPLTTSTQPTPTQALAPQPAAPAMSVFRQHPMVFDEFQRMQSEPLLLTPTWKKRLKLVLHPIQTIKLRNKLPTTSSESRTDRIYMYLQLKKALGYEGKNHLKSLLKTNVLNDQKTDDGHSTLYHLYSMLTTKRAAGLNNEYLVNETVRLLNKPFLITQKFAPLSENASQAILRVRNSPSGMNLNRFSEMPASKPLTWQDINVQNSATCVSSSVMYYMADKCPAELTRQLNQLTSPMQAFYEKVKLTELSPENPQAAYDILKQHQIKYVPNGPDEVWVKVELPQAGLIRAADSNRKKPKQNVRTGIEAAYQSAITYLSTRSYDPATDMRDSEIPGEGSKGLTEMEKTLMETIIKDNGGVASITYQVVAGKQNPAPGQESLPFLYGYTRTFEQTAGDIVEALKMGEFVIIGITDTDQDGSIAGGHEITITSAYVDPVDQQLKFVVVDSDDDIPAPVIRPAKELIPKIHHAGMPLQLSQKIQSEINATPGYYVPDEADIGKFDPLTFVTDPLPADAIAPTPTTPAEEVSAEQTQAQAPAAQVTNPAQAAQPAIPNQQQPLAQDMGALYAPAPQPDPNYDWVQMPVYVPQQNPQPQQQVQYSQPYPQQASLFNYSPAIAAPAPTYYWPQPQQQQRAYYGY